MDDITPSDDHYDDRDDIDRDDQEYEVGYKKPPKASRWPKGQSGNPRGRPKGTRGLKTDLHAELTARMEITMNGKRISASKQRLMVKALTARAATGDARAIAQLTSLIMTVFGADDRGGAKKGLAKEDQQLLDELLGELSPAPPCDGTPEESAGESCSNDQDPPEQGHD